MATVYRNSPSRSPFSATTTSTHYAANRVETNGVLPPQPSTTSGMHLRYNAYAVEGHCVPLPHASSSRSSNNNVVLNGHHAHSSNMAALNLALASATTSAPSTSPHRASIPPPGATLGLLHTTISTTSSTSSSSSTATSKNASSSSYTSSTSHVHVRPAPVPLFLGSQAAAIAAAAPLFVNPAYAHKAFGNVNERTVPLNGLNGGMTELLMVSPGMPTPIELSIYENKQPTGFLHVTIGNQTVEFFDGVANMPKKRT